MKIMNVFRLILVSFLAIAAQPASFASDVSEEAIIASGDKKQAAEAAKAVLMMQSATVGINGARDTLLTEDTTQKDDKSNVEMIIKQVSLLVEAEQQLKKMGEFIKEVAEKEDQGGYFSQLVAGVKRVGAAIIAPFKAGYGYTEDEKEKASKIIEKLVEQQGKVTEKYDALQQDKKAQLKTRYEAVIAQFNEAISEQQVITGDVMSSEKKLLLGTVAAGSAAAGLALAKTYFEETPDEEEEKKFIQMIVDTYDRRAGKPTELTPPPTTELTPPPTTELTPPPTTELTPTPTTELTPTPTTELTPTPITELTETPITELTETPITESTIPTTELTPPPTPAPVVETEEAETKTLEAGAPALEAETKTLEAEIEEEDETKTPEAEPITLIELTTPTDLTEILTDLTEAPAEVTEAAAIERAKARVKATEKEYIQAQAGTDEFAKKAWRIAYEGDITKLNRLMQGQEARVAQVAKKEEELIKKSTEEQTTPTPTEPIETPTPTEPKTEMEVLLKTFKEEAKGLGEKAGKVGQHLKKKAGEVGQAAAKKLEEAKELASHKLTELGFKWEPKVMTAEKVEKDRLEAELIDREKANRLIEDLTDTSTIEGESVEQEIQAERLRLEHQAAQSYADMRTIDQALKAANEKDRERLSDEYTKAEERFEEAERELVEFAAKHNIDLRYYEE